VIISIYSEPQQDRQQKPWRGKYDKQEDIMKKPTSQSRAHQKAQTQKAQRRVAAKKQLRRDEVLGFKNKTVILNETEEA
jgi:hypothetical protein